MPRRFRKVAVGGTFDRLHPGHMELLRTAVEVGEKVVVGVTTDDFVEKMKKNGVEPYDVRVDRVREFMKSLGADFEIVAIEDRYGTTVDDPELEAIVVSPETEPVALEINEERRRRSLEPLTIVVVPFVLDGNGERYSSSKLRGMNG